MNRSLYILCAHSDLIITHELNDSLKESDFAMMNDPRLANPAGYPPAVVIKPASSSAIKIIAGIFAALIALLLGLIVLVLIGFETGPVALLIGMVSAIVPVPLYLVLVLWIDRYEAEPVPPPTRANVKRLICRRWKI